MKSKDLYKYEEDNQKYSLIFDSIKENRQWELTLLKGERKIKISSLDYILTRPINTDIINTQDKFDEIIDNIEYKMKKTRILFRKFDQKALDKFKNRCCEILGIK